MTIAFWGAMLAVTVVAFAPLFSRPSYRPRRRRSPFDQSGRVNLMATAWPAAALVTAIAIGFLLGAVA